MFVEDQTTIDLFTTAKKKNLLKLFELNPVSPIQGKTIKKILNICTVSNFTVF